MCTGLAISEIACLFERRPNLLYKENVVSVTTKSDDSIARAVMLLDFYAFRYYSNMQRQL